MKTPNEELINRLRAPVGVREEAPEQLRKIARALLHAAEQVERGALRRDYGGLVLAVGPGANLRVSGDLKLVERKWDGKEWPGASCPTCGAKGFAQSVLGADRCEFCDGTEGGNPPEAPKYRPAEEDPEDGA